MAQSTTIPLPKDSWTLISQTGVNITSARVQNIGTHDIYIMATAGETPPTSKAGAVLVKPGLVVENTKLVADLFAGVAGANRYYAISDSLAGSVSVSHA